MGTDEQYLLLMNMGWNVGEYGELNIDFSSVTKLLSETLRFFAQCLVWHKGGPDAWSDHKTKYGTFEDKMNTLYDLYRYSDAGCHFDGLPPHIDGYFKDLDIPTDKVRFCHGFSYKTPLHYLTGTGSYGRQLTSDLKLLGFDSVIYGSEYVAFYPSQITTIE